MTDNILDLINFRAKQAVELAKLLALSQAMAPDEMFAEMDFVCLCPTTDHACLDMHCPRANFRAPDKDSA